MIQISFISTKLERYEAVNNEDVDVARERKRVMTGDSSRDRLTIEGLTKASVYDIQITKE
jgi:hypothetical protein